MAIAVVGEADGVAHVQRAGRDVFVWAGQQTGGGEKTGAVLVDVEADHAAHAGLLATGAAIVQRAAGVGQGVSRPARSRDARPAPR